MRLSFLGGASEIGASCTLLEVGDTRILIDCGVRFKGESRLPDLSVLQGKHLDAVLVTHAHSDHTGGLPVISEAFPSAPIYASPPTIDLTMILLRDAVRLMSSPERDLELPLYAQKQVDLVSNAFVPVHHDHEVTVKDVKVRFFPAAHILGASMLHFETPAGNALFTGDFSVSAQRTIPALTKPTGHTDIVVSEATYGERLHEDRTQAETRLLNRIKTILEEGGRVLIPAFAVGRSQEILLTLKSAIRNKTLPEIPIYTDGMVRAVCDVYGRHEKYVSSALFHDMHKAAHPFYTNGIEPVPDATFRKRSLESGPCVIVASSGMLNGGASAFYAEAMVQNPKDAILITGYQDEESPGHALLQLAESEGPREIKLNGRTMPVSCHFEKYGMSAHADRMQAAGLIESLRPKTVVLVHGDDAAKRALSNSLVAQDKVIAKDGDAIVRRYPIRKTASVPKPDDEREMTADALRRFLGPPDDRLIGLNKVAEAWFGRRASADEANRLAAKMIEVGLAQRDDTRRDLLHLLGPSDTNCFPEEAALETALKTENPKGHLLEWCMRRRIAQPIVETSVDGGFYTAVMSIEVDGKTLTSARYRAAAKKTAEQLAAKALLKQINEIPDDVSVTIIDETEAALLKLQNPKGKLLEWCAACRFPTPTVEERAVVNGFQVRICALGNGGNLDSGWFFAQTKKNAEHAASRALLEILSSIEVISDAAPSTESLSQDPVPAPLDTAPDPMMLLNELRQVGLLQNFDYTLQNASGPSHQPMFTTICFAILENGERIESSPIVASAKKAGRRCAASDLVDRLRDIGVLAKR